MSDKPEKPKILGPKPNIACKPKFIPPVNLKGQKIAQDTRKLQQTSYTSQQIENYTSDSFSTNYNTAQIQRPCGYTSTYIQEYNTTTKNEFKETRITERVQNAVKAPNSPSTVCCSILSNTANDCCGVLNAKKELNGKSLTKNESVDSNSSDSGGFKDFVQLDLNVNEKTHQRKKSQPDFTHTTQMYHQRKASQPEHTIQQELRQSFIQKTIQPDPPELRQSFIQNKQHFVANAQALTPFLNDPKYKSIDRPDGEFNRPISKLNIAQTSQMLFEKNEVKPKAKQQIITQGQFQQSTKKLEELLSQRLVSDKVARKGPNCLIDGESSGDVEQKMKVQKQIQTKLHADLQQTVKHIQEIQSIEYRLPQNRKWNEVCVIL